MGPPGGLVTELCQVDLEDTLAPEGQTGCFSSPGDPQRPGRPARIPASNPATASWIGGPAQRNAGEDSSCGHGPPSPGPASPSYGWRGPSSV